MSGLAKRIVNKVLPRPVATRLWSEAQFREKAARLPLGVPERHTLPGELVVSLTSYPARYATLHLTLRSLLRQDTAPDRIVLWIAQADVAALPKKTREILDSGVELRIVEDARSYKKLIFAIPAFPEAYVATADDDVFYPPDWLTDLVAGQLEAASETPVITCHRAHRLGEQGPQNLIPYHDWEWDVQDPAARRPSVDLMPTGIGGILYPPRALHPDAIRRDLFETYAPSADDLWFYWCARRAGTLYRKVGGRFDQTAWWSSQKERLYDHNQRENDLQIAALVRDFGNPLRMPASVGADAATAGR